MTSGNIAPPSVVVISAHSGDFVRRGGGAIALHAQHGSAVHVVRPSGTPTYGVTPATEDETHGVSGT
ncbi:hypothetical protein [Streptomyces sp. NPDC002588]|uniref:hypothetical protein n=1 Tax=Streptomyces sp. NPDC002588 TaxID=3154419 RepID=UPI003317573F